MERPNYYAIIPADVRYDENLVPNAKLLYAEITALSNKEGKCWASDSYFMKLYNVKKRAVQSWLKQLEDNGYIEREVVYDGDTKVIEKRFITLTHKSAPPYSINMHNPIAEKCVDNNTRVNTTSNNNNRSSGNDRSSYSDAFESWWSLYPRKIGKGKAYQIWKKDRLDGRVDELVAKLKDQIEYQYKYTDSKFIPHPTTYLNGCRYDDEIEYKEKENERRITNGNAERIQNLYESAIDALSKVDPTDFDEPF